DRANQQMAARLDRAGGGQREPGPEIVHQARLHRNRDAEDRAALGRGAEDEERKALRQGDGQKVAVVRARIDFAIPLLLELTVGKARQERLEIPCPLMRLWISFAADQIEPAELLVLGRTVRIDLVAIDEADEDPEHVAEPRGKEI